MPLYEYQCEKCGDVFEVIQRFSDTPIQSHQKCGGPVHRLISAPAFQFKGSGWYVTDYAKSKPSGENSGTKADDSGTKKAEAGKPASSSGGSGETSSTPASTANTGGSSSSSDKK